MKYLLPFFALLAISVSSQPFAPMLETQMSSGNAGTTLPSEVLFWKMSEGSGTTTADSSGSSYTGTLVGTIKPVWDSGVPSGAPLYDLSCAGNPTSACYVQTASSLSQLNSVTAATIAAWVYTANSEDSFSVGCVQNSGYRFGFTATSGSGNLYCLVENGGDNNFPSTPYSSTGWHFIAMVFNGSLAAANRVTLYIDGVSQSLANTSGNPSSLDTSANQQAFTFGGFSGTYYIGKYAFVRVFNSALTQAQVSAFQTSWTQ